MEIFFLNLDRLIKVKEQVVEKHNNKVAVINGENSSIGLELDNWPRHRLTDLFTMLKVDGKLKIMNKVLHLHP